MVGLANWQSINKGAGRACEKVKRGESLSLGATAAWQTLDLAYTGSELDRSWVIEVAAT